MFRFVKFRGFFMCVCCFCWRVFEGKVVGNVLFFVGGFSGDILLVVLKLVKLLLFFVDLNFVKFFFERKNIVK